MESKIEGKKGKTCITHWKENIFTFTAHVSLAPVSTIAPIVVLDNGGPGCRCACPPAPINLLATGADYPAAIVLLRIGNRQSGDNRRSTSFCRW